MATSTSVLSLSSEADQGDDLPDTQPTSISKLPHEDESSSVFAESHSDLWGKLLPLSNSFLAHDLCKSEYTFGRAPRCDIVFGAKKIDKVLYGLISKLHFKLVDKTGLPFLEDLSSNGTFVNRIIVGEGKSVLLQNNDVISLSAARYEAFVFISTRTMTMTVLHPSEITSTYLVSCLLGTGTFGEVRLVFHKTTLQRYAMKTISKHQAIQSDTTARREAEILLHLKNDFIIQVIEIFDFPQTLHLILELMEGGSLLARITDCKRMEEDEAKWVFYQVAKAVQYLHSHGISHRDLKLENVLMRQNVPFPLVKLADFGMAKFFDSSLLKTFCGTPHYMAPEILLSQVIGENHYTKEVDMWSLGVMLYIIISGDRPYEYNPQLQLYMQIVKNPVKFTNTLWTRISYQAKSLILEMLTIEPGERATVDNVIMNRWFEDDQEMVNKLTACVEDIQLPKKRIKLEHQQ